MLITENKSPFWVGNDSIFSGNPVSFDSDNQVIYSWLEVDAEWNSYPNIPVTPITIQLKGLGLENPLIYEHPALKINQLPTWKQPTVIAEILGLNCHIQKRQDSKLKIWCIQIGLFF